MPDDDGYPTEEEIKQVELLAGKFGGAGIPDLWKPEICQKVLDHLQAIWHWPEWGFMLKEGQDDFKKPCMKLELHTGGWSGNEEVMGALEGTFFWVLFWEHSRRGGHYYFEIPKREEKSEPK